MQTLPTAPFLSYEKIKGKARSFLHKFHPNGDIPIPIENIIDIKIGIVINPIPGLMNIYETDGFLCSDLKEIWVDRDLYLRKHPRYYFTLAHEIGHYYLHKSIYKQIKIKDTTSWKSFIKNLDEKNLSWFEYQAYAFAGLVLVPTKQLRKRSKFQLARIKKAGGKTPSIILPRLIDELCKDFFVSTPVIKKRLKKENILPSDLQKELLLNSYPF